jgi:gas vesicle protein
MNDPSINQPTSSNKNSDNNSAIWGFIWGLVIGGVIAVLRAPRLNVVKFQNAQPLEQLKQVQQEIREKLSSVVQNDPLSESIAEGKAAARRRLAELGISRQDITPTQTDAP